MSVKIMCVGDNLIHKELYLAARTNSESYDFTSFFEHLTDRIASADIAAINQETIFVADDSKVSSFPAFGSPFAVGEAIAQAGFNVVTHASNHALDKGYQAIQETLSFWEAYRDHVTVLGIHGSQSDQERIPIITKGGIRFALINATTPLNFHRVPRNAPFCLDVLNNRTRTTMLKRVARAKAEADFVIVFPHWGYEYLYEPSDKQQRWAHDLAQAGADLIIGTHPHVLQTIEEIPRNTGQATLCYYSLGNFISCQVGAATMLGGLAEIEVDVIDGKARIISHAITPLVTHTNQDYSYFTVYPLDEYTDALARENRIFRTAEKRNEIERIDCPYLEKLFKDILNKEAQRTNRFQSPWDVRKMNIKAVFKTLAGKNMKR